MTALSTSNALKQIPVRALVAYAARCARRVQPLYSIDGDHPEAEDCKAAIDGAICLAEGFAAGMDIDRASVSRVESGVVRALLLASELENTNREAAYAANCAYAVVAATTAAIEAAWAEDPAGPAQNVADSATIVTEAAIVADASVERAARLDWEMLHRMQLGRFPELGEPIDPTESGILGPLQSRTPRSKGRRSSSAPARPARPDGDAPAATETGEAADSEGLQQLRHELQAEQQRLQAQLEELHAEEQRLREERAAFEAQRQAQAGLENASSGSSNEAEHGQPPLDADFERQRQELDEQRAQLESEREQLQAERAAVSEQQAALERQRVELDEASRQLEAKQAQAASADPLPPRSQDGADPPQPSQPSAQPGAVGSVSALHVLVNQLQQERQQLQAERARLVEQFSLLKAQSEKQAGGAPAAAARPKPAAVSGKAANALRVVLELGTSRSAQISVMLQEMSELYRKLGGPGVEFTCQECRLLPSSTDSRDIASSSAQDRAFTEILARPAKPSDQATSRDYAYWERFLSCLSSSLKLTAGLDDYFDFAGVAPPHHACRRLVDEAIEQAAEADRERAGEPSSDSSGLSIDAVNRQLWRIEELRKRMERDQAFAIDLVPCEDESERPDSTKEQAAEAGAAPRRSLFRLWKIFGLFGIAAGLAGAAYWLIESEQTAGRYQDLQTALLRMWK